MVAVNKPTISKPIAKPTKEEVAFRKQFYELMFELDLYNKFKKTYYLDIKNKTNYGFYAHIYLVAGLSFKKLQDNREIIEQNLKCLWIMQIESFKEYAKVQIVLNPIDKELEYTNPKIKPHELYLGQSFSNHIQKNNNNDNCMFLLAGAVGSGKTRYIYQVLLSWILSCSPNDVCIYLSDIAKNEYLQFRNIKHVKYYASEIDDLHHMMRLLSKEFKRRKKLLEPYREKMIATNIDEYNLINKNNKLAYCYIVIDEFSILLPDRTDGKEEKDQKEFILDILKQLAKLGRSLGMFTFMATQKTTRDEIPPIIKSNSAVRISFRANDSISSEVIMLDNSATGLPERVAIFSQNGGTEKKYLYAPKLTMEKLKELLKPYREDSPNIEPNLKNNISSLNTFNTTVTRIEKGKSYKEILKLYKSMSNKEDDFIDY